MQPIVPSARASAVVEFVRTRRSIAAYILLAVAALLLIATIWLGIKGFRPSGGGEPTVAGETAGAIKAPANFHQGEYLLGFVLALAGALPPLLVGFWLLYRTPDPSEDKERTRSRVAILASGGLLGLVLMLAGLAFFYTWSPSLAAWIDRGDAKEAKWVLLPLLTFLAGAILLFAAVQPARAEERHNPNLRRLVYGSNLVLTLLLLLAVLVTGNLVLFQRVPNRLDTTETGFYTLSPQTEQFLSTLEQPVTAYALLPEGEGRIIGDARRMLLRCQEASHGKFKVNFISPLLDRQEYARLRAKYPQVEVNDLGVLLTVGADESRHAFIRAREFVGREEGQGPRGRETFAGEARVMKELAFLVQSSGAKPVVYFTQANGELEIGAANAAAGATPPDYSARRLKDYLEKNFVDVRPLAFELAAPKVPPDADVVVVAQPQTPLAEGSVKAIRQFMAAPRPDGKKGKLVVLAGTHPVTGRPVVKTGLEPLLEEFNIGVGDKYMYNAPTDRNPADQILAIVSPLAVRAGNPVAQAFAGFAIRFTLPREVAPLSPDRANPKYKTLAVMVTVQPTWLEETPSENPERTWLDITEKQSVARAKVAVASPRGLAVFTSEADGTTARVAVFGDSLLVSDALAPGGETPRTFELFGGTVDWLRDRPTVAPGSAGKVYENYTLSPGVDETRLQWLPLGLALLAVIGVGVGVWVVRRA